MLIEGDISKCTQQDITCINLDQTGAVPRCEKLHAPLSHIKNCPTGPQFQVGDFLFKIDDLGKITGAARVRGIGYKY